MAFIVGIVVFICGYLLLPFGRNLNRVVWEMWAAGVFFCGVGIYFVADHLDGAWSILPATLTHSITHETIDTAIGFGALLAASAAAIAVIGQLRQLKVDAEKRQLEYEIERHSANEIESRKEFHEGLQLLGSDSAAAQIAGLHVVGDYMVNEPQRYHLMVSRAIAAMINDVSRLQYRALEAAVNDGDPSHLLPNSPVFRDAIETLARVDRTELVQRYGSQHAVTLQNSYFCELLLRPQHRFDFMHLNQAALIDTAFLGSNLQNTLLNGVGLGWVVFDNCDLRGANLRIDTPKPYGWYRNPSIILARRNCRVDHATRINGIKLAGIGEDFCVKYDPKSNSFERLFPIPPINILEGFS